MAAPFVFKTYQVTGTPETVRHNLDELLRTSGLAGTGTGESTLYYRYPSFTFSSKRPLSCLSRLAVSFSREGEDVSIRVGATFTKIRYYTIAVFTLVCVVLPALISYYERGAPTIPPPSYLGLPLGVMVHYHVRWRAFHAIRQLIHQAGG